MFSFLKKAGPDNGTEAYEEIGEKRTTGVGFILLVLMAVLLIIAGETVFNDLNRIPDRVVPPSYVIANLVNERGVSNYSSYRYNYGYNDGVTPTFNELDREYSLDVLYRNIEPTVNEIQKIDEEINNLNSQLSQNQYQITSQEQQYNLGLQEKIANEQVLYNREAIQANITALRALNEEIQRKLGDLETSRNKKKESISTNIAELKVQYLKAEDAYRYNLVVYKMKIFLLQLLFVLPFFAISTRYYFRLKKNNSPYTIIATAVMGSSAILFFQIVIVLLYEVIPHEWIQKIWNLFTSIPLFRYILYYGSVLLVVAVFGGLVYLIQKRMFNSKIVAIRRLKNNKCPNCEFSIHKTEDFCPKCGTTLKEKCNACGNKRICNLAFCPTCGKRQVEAPKVV